VVVPTVTEDEIIEAKEPAPRQYVGAVVRFYLRRRGGTETLEQGEVIAQRWLGVTKRGKVPEYEVTIAGKAGRSVLARVSRDHVMQI
jgi:hypothetical protein